MPVEEWNPSPNFSSREGRKINTIVDHITQGSFPGCVNWLKNPVSGVSAHYVVTKLGRIIQLVKEGDKAWSNGSYNRGSWNLYDGTNPNLTTISIEHEGLTGELLTEAQYQSSLFLHRELIAKYSLPIDEEHIIGHYRLDSVNKSNCPGSGFPWVRLFSDLRSEPVTILKAHEPSRGSAPVQVVASPTASFVMPRSNATCVNYDLFIRDANGTRLGTRQVDKGDRMFVLDVGYTSGQLDVEYPTKDGVSRGFVKNIPSCVQYDHHNEWLNGTSKEIGYSAPTGTNKIGSIDAHEHGTILYKSGNRYHVMYGTVAKGPDSKSVYVDFPGL